MPSANEKDLLEIPEAIRLHLNFSFLSYMDEVLASLLLPEVETPAC